VKDRLIDALSVLPDHQTFAIWNDGFAILVVGWEKCGVKMTVRKI
jgi:hypothetical protein